MIPETRQELFEYMSQEHRVFLFATDMSEIEGIVLKGREKEKNRDPFLQPVTIEQIINIKPLSVNSAWQGKRFKTKAYKQYERDVLYQLKAASPPPTPYRIDIEFGFMSVLSDIDNPVKCFVDILQKKYGINDKDVYEMNLKKTIVKKGYVKFSICQLK